MTQAEIDSSANFYKNLVIVGSQDATLYALNAETGAVVWDHTVADYRLGFRYTSGPIIGRSVGGTQVDIEAYTMDNNFIADFDTGPIAHTALLGVDHRTFSTRSVTGPFPATTGLNALAPDHDLPIRFPAFTSTSRIDAQQTGVYFQDQAKFDRFILTLGGRYDTARQTGLQPPEWLGHLPGVGAQAVAWWNENLSVKDSAAELFHRIDRAQLLGTGRQIGAGLVRTFE